MWLGMGRKQLSGVSSHEDVIHVTFVNSLSVMTSTWELGTNQRPVFRSHDLHRPVRVKE